MTDEELPRFRFGLPDSSDNALWSDTDIARKANKK